MPEIPTSWMAGEPDTYSIESLTALDDSALSELAAELRGWGKELVSYERAYWDGLGFGNGELLQDVVYKEDDRVIIETDKWLPATDRNQSGALLQWAIAKGAEFEISLSTDSNIDFRTHRQDWQTVDCSSSFARAETVAFCAAMLAMEGGLK